METTLILFSGLAGTGKSTLANALGRELKIPIISFDYFIDYALPRHVMTEPGNWTNQDVFEMMNKLAGQRPFKKLLAPSLTCPGPFGRCQGVCGARETSLACGLPQASFISVIKFEDELVLLQGQACSTVPRRVSEVQ